MDTCLERQFLLSRNWSEENCSHCNLQDLHALNKENHGLLTTFTSLVQIHKEKWQTWGLWWKDDLNLRLQIALKHRNEIETMALKKC